MALGEWVSALAVSMLALAQPQGVEQVTSPALAPQHQQDLRCTMLALSLAQEAERGASGEGYEPSREQAEALAEGVADFFNAAYDLDKEATRALIKADYEAFSREAAERFDAEGPAWAEAQAEACLGYWGASVDAGKGGEAPTAPDGTPVDAFYCVGMSYAFFAKAHAENSEVAAHFKVQGDRIADRIMDGAEDGNVAELGEAIAAFDVESFDALEEAEAETIMLWCEALSQG